MTADRAPMGSRLADVRRVLQEAGLEGLPMSQVASLVGVPPRLMSVMLANYRRAGHVDRIGPFGKVRWVLGTGVRPSAPAAQPSSAVQDQLVTPGKGPRLQAPARRPGAPLETTARPATSPVGPRQAGPDLSVVDGVVIQRCPAGRDTRYEVTVADLARPDGTGFAAEWRQRTGQA